MKIVTVSYGLGEEKADKFIRSYTLLVEMLINFFQKASEKEFEHQERDFIFKSYKQLSALASQFIAPLLLRQISEQTAMPFQLHNRVIDWELSREQQVKFEEIDKSFNSKGKKTLPYFGSIRCISLHPDIPREAEEVLEDECANTSRTYQQRIDTIKARIDGDHDRFISRSGLLTSLLSMIDKAHKDQTNKIIIPVESLYFAAILQVCLLEKCNVSSLIYSGEVSAKERAVLVDQFNNTKDNRVIIFTKAGFEGINLFGNIVLLPLSWYNPQQERQAIARATRASTPYGEIFVYRFQSRSVWDKRVRDLHQLKLHLHNVFVENRSLTPEDFISLITLHAQNNGVELSEAVKQRGIALCSESSSATNPRAFFAPRNDGPASETDDYDLDGDYRMTG